MQKHSLGPRSPVKRDGEAQPECEGGTQQGKLKSKQQIKKKGGGEKKKNKPKGRYSSLGTKMFQSQNLFPVRIPGFLRRKKKKSNKLKRGSQTSYIYLYI